MTDFGPDDEPVLPPPLLSPRKPPRELPREAPPAPPPEPAAQLEAQPEPDLEEVEPEEEAEPAPRAVDPALLYIVLIVVTIVGLNRVAPDVRYTLVWSLLIILAGVAIALDKIPLESIQISNVVIGLGFGALIGLPVLAVAAGDLNRISSDIFGGASDVAVFQMLAITMPLAEGLYFRAAMQESRSAVFTGIAAGVWAMALFFPQLNVLKFPLVAVMIGLCLVLVNSVYSYLRHRFGLFSSWACQITINLLLLFVSRFLVQ